MKIARDELYDIVTNLCGGGYSLGLHGIRTRKGKDELFEKSKRNLNEGIKCAYRTLNRTVYFCGRIADGRNEEKIRKSLQEYEFDKTFIFSIVAIPISIRNSEGDEFFIGSPNYHLFGKMERDIEQKYKEAEGITTYAGELLKDGVPGTFVLGNYRVVDDNVVNLTLNSKHPCFNGNIVADDEFNEMKNKLSAYCMERGYPMLDGNMSLEAKENMAKCISDDNKYQNPVMFETVRQYLDEENVVPIKSSKIDREYILKILESPDTKEEYDREAIYSPNLTRKKDVIKPSSIKRVVQGISMGSVRQYLDRKFRRKGKDDDITK